MEKYFAYDDSILSNNKRKNRTTRPTCSISSSPPTTGSVSLRSDAEHVGEERQYRIVRPDAPMSMDTEYEILGRRRKTALVRSKTFDHSLLSQIPNDCERKKSHSSQFSKTNSQYHKNFKEVSKDELLRQSYTCALQKDILYQGRLFVSDNWICFHSKVFGKDTKIAIPVPSVSIIKKTKTAILVPNALVITTTNDRHVLVSFLSRDTTYKFLMSVCFHLDEKSAGNCPTASSVEHSFRVDCPSPLLVDFSADFSDLDGTVRQRRQVMEDSSSSDSQSPDYEKIAAFMNVVKQGETPTPSDIHLQHAPDAKKGLHFSGPSEAAEVVYDMKSLRPVSLNTLLVVCLFLVFILVLSSCYMAFKILSLEQQLTSLGSTTEYSHNGHEYHRAYTGDNAEINSMLSMNILKLEKIQRNLQRLLEETQ